MNSTPSKFEVILAEVTARKYMVKRFSRRNLWIEVSGSGSSFSDLIGDDMIHFDELRAEIRKALATEGDLSQQVKKAIFWISFLKPRIEMLEYQSALRSSFAGYSAAAMALLALGLSVLHDPVASGGAVATGALIAMYISIRRLRIDRRRAWYKYVVAHLDAIKSP